MRPFAESARRWVCSLALVLAAAQATAHAQTPAEEKLQILTDPESVKAKAKAKEKEIRPPLEFFRTQVAPFDILPYVKANHWCSVGLEMRANHDDYAGTLQTIPVPLLGMPQEVVYERDARLVKGQQSRLAMQMMLPSIPRELSFEIARPESIRPDEIWSAALRVLEPHQMLVLILSKQTNEYANWNRFQAFFPASLDRGDALASDRLRYYRLVLPLDPEKPMLSSHPLTWTTISHVIWDGLSPDAIGPSQQQAMIDWLHWGGQLIVTGGASTSFNALRDSFLGPYLPAEPSGENALLDAKALAPVSDAYPPPRTMSRDEPEPEPLSDQEGHERFTRYRPPVPIRPAAKRPLFLAGLTPKPGATGIGLGEATQPLLGVEARVGRGRVLMLAINPHDPALVAWPGLDTFIRRVVLRRPEEPRSPGRWEPTGYQPPVYGLLSGPELSWVRYLSRDLGSTARRLEPYAKTATARSDEAEAPPSIPGAGPQAPPLIASNEPVAEWLDSSELPALGRSMLEQASGISIPTPRFVLKVIFAYLLALVPLNWLICRYLLGRRELAWVVVPLVSIGFAVGVERAAAYDLGFDLASDEIDVIETYGGYPRAHVSRFASLYATGRVRFSVSYPNDPTALALPMSTGNALRGEEISTAAWHSYPTPGLMGFRVQPRSLSMFRAEQMVTMDGAMRLESGPEARRVVNETGLELRDAMLVDFSDDRERQEIELGTIPPGGTVEVRRDRQATPAAPATEIDPRPLLELLRTAVGQRPEDRGEIRLVAWTPKPLGGQKLEPPVDRHRGFGAVVVHLRNGPPPGPDGPTYNQLASSDPPSPPPNVAPRRPWPPTPESISPLPTGPAGSPRRVRRGPRPRGPNAPTATASPAAEARSATPP